MATTNRKLDELIAKINDGHQQCVKALRSSLAHARKTGTYLLEARELVEGKWLLWVQENCRFSVSEAQRYIRIANRYSELLAKCLDPDKLTMTEALRLLSPGKDKANGKAKPDDKRLTVASWEEVKERETNAEQLRFDAGSREHQFIQEKAASLARQVLQLARHAKVKDEDDNPIEGLDVAIALIKQLKKALKVSLVVKVTEAEAVEDESGVKAKPVNRLNGKLAKMPK